MSRIHIKTDTSVSERVRQFEEKGCDVRKSALLHPRCYEAYRSDPKNFMREKLTSNYDSRRSVDEILGNLPRSPAQEPRRAFEYNRAPDYDIAGAQHHGRYNNDSWLHANEVQSFQEPESVKNMRKSDALRIINSPAVMVASNNTSDSSLPLQRSSTDSVQSAKEAAQVDDHKAARGVWRRSWSSDVHNKLHKDPPIPKLPKAAKKEISDGSNSLRRRLGFSRYRQKPRPNGHAAEAVRSGFPSANLLDDSLNGLNQLDNDQSRMEVNAGRGNASPSEPELERDIDSGPVSFEDCNGTFRIGDETDASDKNDIQIGRESGNDVADAGPISPKSGVEEVQLKQSRALLLDELQHHLQRTKTVRSDGSIDHRDYGTIICGPYTNRISQKVSSFAKPLRYNEVVATSHQDNDDCKSERKQSSVQAVAQDEADYEERIAQFVPPQLDALFGKERAQFALQMAQNEEAYRARMAQYVQDDSEAQPEEPVDDSHEVKENEHHAATDARSVLERTASYTHQDALTTIDEATETEEEYVSCESRRDNGKGSPFSSDETTDATHEDDDERELERGIARRQSVTRVTEPKAVNIRRSISLPKGKERALLPEEDDDRVDTPFQSQLMLHNPDTMPQDPGVADMPDFQKDHVSWWEGGRSGPLAYGAAVPKFACGPRVHVAEMEVVRPRAPTPEAGRVKRDEVHPCLLLGQAFDAGGDDTFGDAVVADAGVEDDNDEEGVKETEQVQAEPSPRKKSVDEVLEGLHLPVLEPIPKEEIVKMAKEMGLWPEM